MEIRAITKERVWSRATLISVLLRYILCSGMLVGGTSLLALMAWSKIYWLGLTFAILGGLALLFITGLLVRGVIKKDLSAMV